MDILFEYQRPLVQIARDLRNDRHSPTGPRLFGDVMRAHFQEDVDSGLAAAQVVIERIELARREGACGYLAFQSEWDSLDRAFRDLLDGAKRTRATRLYSAH